MIQPEYSNKNLAINTFYNLIGKILPLVAGLLCIPILIGKIGLARFGILTLAWTLMGYFGLFNMGIGRATTKYVAEYFALNKHKDLPDLIWTSLILLLALGSLGALVIYLVTPFLVDKFFNIPVHLLGETQQAFYLMAIAIPVVFSTAGAQAVLEAQQRFALINAMVGALFSPRLDLMVALLLAARLMVWLVFLYFCLQSLPEMTAPRLPKLVYIKELVVFGGWLTVTNIIGPLMVYMDRFLIGSLLTMEALAYYVTPYEVVTRLWIIPASLMPVLFPAFSALNVSEEDKLETLYSRSVKYLVLILAPIVVCLVIFARPFLGAWLGPGFAQSSTPIFQLLSIGVLVNSLSQVPYSAIQAMGRPDLTAKLHLIELPLYLGILWLSLSHLGILGAALAWVLRVGLDAALLFYLFYKMMPAKKPFFPNLKLTFIFYLVAMMIGIYFTTIIPFLLIKILLLPVIIISFGVLSWRMMLNNDERSQLYLMQAKLRNIIWRNGGAFNDLR
jgi:O-antigen/teichoic acid export membrane protein